MEDTFSVVILSIIIGTLAAIVYSLRILVLLEQRIARMDENIERITNRVAKEEQKIEATEKRVKNEEDRILAEEKRIEKKISQAGRRR
jgi:hypothetical protein